MTFKTGPVSLTSVRGPFPFFECGDVVLPLTRCLLYMCSMLLLVWKFLQISRLPLRSICNVTCALLFDLNIAVRVALWWQTLVPAKLRHRLWVTTSLLHLTRVLTASRSCGPFYALSEPKLPKPIDGRDRYRCQVSVFGPLTVRLRVGYVIALYDHAGTLLVNVDRGVLGTPVQVPAPLA